MKHQSEAWLRAMAQRCETAKHKRCKCRCGGAMHGIAHADEWIAEEVRRERTLSQLAPSEQMDWIGFSERERQLGLALPVVRAEAALLSMP
jgi:hypothetical protein